MLLRHAWAAQAFWSAETKEPGYAVAYAGRLVLAAARLSRRRASWRSRRTPATGSCPPGRSPTPARRSRSPASRARSRCASGWSGTRYDTLPGEPRPGPAAIPIRSRTASSPTCRCGARTRDARRFVRSISPEEGRSACAHAALRGPGHRQRLRPRARARPRSPSTCASPGSRGRRPRAAALRRARARHRSAGARRSSSAASPSRTCSPSRSAAASAPDALRGYPTGSFEGTGFVLANVELRFPLGGAGAAAARPGRSSCAACTVPCSPTWARRSTGQASRSSRATGSPPTSCGSASARSSASSSCSATTSAPTCASALARAMGAPFGGWRAADARALADEVSPYVVFGASF